MSKERLKQIREELSKCHNVERAYMAELLFEAILLAGPRRCKYCYCTDEQGCTPPCWWIAGDVCSSCKEAMFADEPTN